MSTNEKSQAGGLETGVGTSPTRATAIGGYGSSLHRIGPSVKKQHIDVLLRQAEAAEQRATAATIWHRERAARYLAWVDLVWAGQRYDWHLAQAEFQDRLAARHRAVIKAMIDAMEGS